MLATKKNILQNALHIKTLIVLIIHLGVALVLAYSILTIISIILPIAFELIYTLWTQLFYIFIPLTIIVSSLLVILLPNPIYALIALIIVFLSTAIFLLSIQVQFLAFIYLIVYIGAIAILFLFIIMLFNLRSLQKSDMKIKDFSFLTISFKFYLFFGIKFFMIVSLDILNLIEYSTYMNTSVIYKQFDLQHFLTYVHWDVLLFSHLFYTYYSYIFVLAGLILLVAMVGSIVLALSTTELLIYTQTTFYIRDPYEKNVIEDFAKTKNYMRNSNRRQKKNITTSNINVITNFTRSYMTKISNIKHIKHTTSLSTINKIRTTKKSNTTTSQGFLLKPITSDKKRLHKTNLNTINTINITKIMNTNLSQGFLQKSKSFASDKKISNIKHKTNKIKTPTSILNDPILSEKLLSFKYARNKYRHTMFTFLTGPFYELWEKFKDWYYGPNQPYIKEHVLQVRSILKKDGLSFDDVFEKALIARANDPLADQKRAYYGFEIEYSNQFYDHETNELITFAFDCDVENPNIKGNHREAFRMTRSPRLRLHPDLRAFINKIETDRYWNS